MDYLYFLGSRYPLHRLMWFHAWVGEKVTEPQRTAVLYGTGIQFRPGKWAVEFRHNSIWPLLFSSTHSFVRLLQKAHNKGVTMLNYKYLFSAVKSVLLMLFYKWHNL